MQIPPTLERDDVIAAAIAAGKTRTAAAALAGVSRTTVSRRLTDPAFLKRVVAFRAPLILEALGALSAAAPEAVAALAGILKGDSSSAAERLRAADLLLNHLDRLRKADELDARVRDLEAKLDVAPGPTPPPGTAG